jgi:hypothetical protein
VIWGLGDFKVMMFEAKKYLAFYWGFGVGNGCLRGIMFGRTWVGIGLVSRFEKFETGLRLWFGDGGGCG